MADIDLTASSNGTIFTKLLSEVTHPSEIRLSETIKNLILNKGLSYEPRGQRSYVAVVPSKSAMP